MRHLADPAVIAPGVFSWVFLAGLLILLPAAVLLQERQLRALRAAGHALSRRDIYIGAAVTHVVLLAGAVGVARDAGLTLFPAHELTRFDLTVGIGAVMLGGVALLPRVMPDHATERAEAIAPRSGREAAAFGAIAVSAGISEELAYRGVLFSLLAHLVGGWWIPALIAALAFGIVHLFQGWRAATLAAAAGLVAQIVVGLTGTLLVAIGAHIVHDLIAGAVIRRRAERRSRGGDPVAV
jgi:membrane protease YdiL (CAAX protease family)